MAIAQVQFQAFAANIASGSTGSFSSAVTNGNTVLVAAHTSSGPISSLSGLGATWTQVSAVNISGSTWYQVWVGTGCTGGTAITFNGGFTFDSWGLELSGGGAVTSGGTATAGTGTTAALTFTGLTAGKLLFAIAVGASAFATQPWTHLDNGGGTGSAYELTTDSTDQTATWTWFTGGAWAVAGAVVALPAAAANSGFLAGLL